MTTDQTPPTETKNPELLLSMVVLKDCQETVRSYLFVFAVQLTH